MKVERIALDDLAPANFSLDALESLEVPPPTMPLGSPVFSEDALANHFSEKYGDRWRYVAARAKWLHWNGKVWEEEATLKVFDLARHLCREIAKRGDPAKASRVASKQTIAAVEALARSDRRHAATVKQWDADPWILNTTNGIVDLRTGVKIPHESNRYLTKITAASLAPEAPCHRWIQFLDEITGGNIELQAYLARIVGYTLSGSTREHALFFFYGPGANGKSVFVNTLASILGDYSTVAPLDMFMESRSDRHPTDLAKLMGARLVIATEISAGSRLNEAKIKLLTGGDVISARFMRGDFFDFQPSFKLIICGNSKPGLRHVDEAMRRRLHLIPFNVTIPIDMRDPDLQEKLLAEKDSILTWALNGCQEWLKTGLNPPQTVVDATKDYFENQDALGRWITECCDEDPNATELTNELFDSWKMWAENNGEYIGPLNRFSEELSKRGYERWLEPVTRRKGFRGIERKQGERT